MTEATKAVRAGARELAVAALLNASLLCTLPAREAAAVVVPVPNFSFEQPDGGVGNPNGGPATGWTANGGTGFGGVSYFSFGFAAASQGTQYHWLNLPGFGGPNPSVTQSNAGLIGAAQAGTYTLTVAGGRRDNDATTDGSYVVELLAGGTVVGSQTVNNPFATYAPGTWNDITVLAVVAPTSAAIGQDLSIRLSAFNGTGGIRSQGQFDNVRLTFDPVPADYAVTLSSGALTVSDVSGNGDPLAITEPAAGSIQFAAAGRVFSVNGGPNLLSNSGAISLSGVTSITVNAGGGNDSVSVGAFTSALPSLTLNGGAGDDAVTFGGALALASNANLDVDLQNDGAPVGVDAVTLTAGAGVSTSGTGSITIRCSRNVLLNPGSGLQTVNGALTVEANRQLSGASPGDFWGVRIDSALVRANGSGPVAIAGRGGNGVLRQYGVGVTSSGSIVGGTTSALTVDGIGGAGLGVSNQGVRVEGLITSLGAGVRVVGQGGGTIATSGTGQIGVVVSGATGRVTAGGGGAVTVEGFGGAGTGNQNSGIQTQLGGTITSGGGDVRVSGQGSLSAPGGNLHEGVAVILGSTITAGGAGTVTVQGTGGQSPGGQHAGIALEQNASITSSGGGVFVSGIGGGPNPFANFNSGILTQVGGFISSGGGDVALTGVHGVGPQAAGIQFNGGSGISTVASGGNLTLTADFIALATGSTVATPTTGTVTVRPLTNGRPILLLGPGWTGNFGGYLTLLDEELDVIDAGTINIGDENSGFLFVAGPVAHPPSSSPSLTSEAVRARKASELRAATGFSRSVPALDSREPVVGAESKNVRETDSPALTLADIDGPESEARPSGVEIAGAPARFALPTSPQAIVSNFNLTSGGDIVLETSSNRSFDAGGGTLHLKPGPGAAVRPTGSGTDVTASALTMGSGTKLAIAINGVTPDTLLTRLNVAGPVDLNGAELALSGSHVPSIGEQFAIVRNSAFATTGTFNGLPEGAYLLNFLGSPLAARITYQGTTPPSVPNFSFEQPNGGVDNPDGGPATGWVANGGPGLAGVSYFSFGFPAASQGTQYFWLNLPGFGGPNPSGTRSKPGQVGTADVGTYTLTVAGGRRDNGATTDGSYVVELLAGDTVIGSQTVNNPFATYAPGTWNDITAIAVVAPGSPVIGQDLSIRLSAYDGTGGIRSQGQFDNVRLSFAPLGPSHDVVLTVVSPTTDAPTEPALPAVSGLSAARPNPFTREANLTFALTARGNVDLAIYSADGRRVRSLAHGAHEPGEYHRTWNGMAENGRRAQPGMYFVRLTTPQGTFHRRIVKLD